MTFGIDSERKFMCPLCFQQTCSLRFDKKGKPYMRCGNCVSRTFISSAVGLSWVAMVAKDVLLKLQNAGTLPAHISIADPKIFSEGLMEGLKNGTR